LAISVEAALTDNTRHVYANKSHVVTVTVGG